LAEEVFFVVIALILLLILIVLVAFLILQIRKTARSLEGFLKSTQGSLNPILSELKESIERINRTTKGIEESVTDVQHLTRSIKKAGMVIDEVNNLLRKTGSSFAVKTACIGAGIKAGLGVLAKGPFKKGGEKDE